MDSQGTELFNFIVGILPSVGRTVFGGLMVLCIAWGAIHLVPTEDNKMNSNTTSQGNFRRIMVGFVVIFLLSLCFVITKHYSSSELEEIIYGFTSGFIVVSVAFFRNIGRKEAFEMLIGKAGVPIKDIASEEVSKNIKNFK